MSLFSEITENIKVSVRPLYLEAESNVLSRKFVFAYFLNVRGKQKLPPGVINQNALQKRQ